MAALIGDVKAVIELVVNSHKYSQQQKDSWQPISEWGEMARFKDNVLQGRFMPRIGETWCNGCQFLEICQQNNPDDWQKYYESKSPAVMDENVGTVLLSDLRESIAEPDQGDLFEGLKNPRKKNLGKSDRIIKKEMLAGGQFVPAKKIPSLINKIVALIPVKDSFPCPCRRLGLMPVNVLASIPDFIDGKLSIDELVGRCPYPECPFKKSGAN